MLRFTCGKGSFLHILHYVCFNLIHLPGFILKYPSIYFLPCRPDDEPWAKPPKNVNSIIVGVFGPLVGYVVLYGFSVFVHLFEDFLHP